MSVLMLFSVQDVKRGPTFLDKEPEESRDEKEPNLHKRPTAYLLTQQVNLHVHKTYVKQFDCDLAGCVHCYAHPHAVICKVVVFISCY